MYSLIKMKKFKYIVICRLIKRCVGYGYIGLELFRKEIR